MESPSHLHAGRRIPLRKPAPLPNVIETKTNGVLTGIIWTLVSVGVVMLGVWGYFEFFN